MVAKRQTPLFLLLTLAPVACMPPSWGAGALLHPSKTVATDQGGLPHETLWFDGTGVRLPKELMLIPRAGHNDCLNANTWAAIDSWAEKFVTPPRM